MKVLAASLPPISKEFFERLEQAFPPIDVTPEVTIEEIMYSAGQKLVIDWVRHAVRDTIITGGPIDTYRDQ